VDEGGRVTWRKVWLPAALVALGSAELASLGSDGWMAAIALEAVSALLLVFRRRYPLLVGTVSTVPLSLIPLTGTQMNEPAVPLLFYFLAVFSLGRYRRDLRGVVALVAVLVWTFVVTALLDPRQEDLTDVFFVVALAVPPYVFGRIIMRLDEQGRQLEAQQEVIAHQAVVAERSRISRELHDVIAHALSVMVVQTAAAQDVVRSDPAKAADLLTSVADAGRTALAETGRVLHSVRDDTDELGLQPAPGLADLPPLVESFRTGGLDIQSTIRTPDEPLPAAIDVSAYRIVQEALTNALKYGEGTAQIVLETDARQLRFSCSNPVGSASSTGVGLGLLGMAERVSLLGGTLRSGPTPDRRFEVEATIPLVSGAS